MRGPEAVLEFPGVAALSGIRMASGRFGGPGLRGDGRHASRVSNALRSRRILLVEDEVLVSMDIEDALTAAGARVVGPCTTMRAAFALADRDGLIDAAILDILLGREEVYPLAEALLQREIPLLFHTGHGEPGDLTVRFPRSRVCRKPTATEDLMQELASLLPPATD